MAQILLRVSASATSSHVAALALEPPLDALTEARSICVHEAETLDL